MDADAHRHPDSNAARALWDAAAADFDDEPDHGLRDPAVRAAWQAALAAWLPSPPGRALDAGCGTGSLSILLAELGHDVTGIDLSPAMIARAEAKAADHGRAVAFRVMDAAAPALPAGRYDAVVCRHVLWALPDPAAVLARWVDLLRPGGRLLLIEGFWHTGGGLHAADLLALRPPSLVQATVHNLSDRTDLWGGPVTDVRYAITADLPFSSFLIPNS